MANQTYWEPTGAKNLCEIKDRIENDERVFELTFEGKTVCSARTLGYELLESITTDQHERRKHYGTRLLQHIEEIARQNEVFVMKTTDIDSKDTAAVYFFRKTGYKLEPIEENGQFLEGSKKLVIEQVKSPKDPKLLVLLYLLEFRHYGVKEKNSLVSLKYIAEKCKFSIWVASRHLEELRNVPPDEQFFQITRKGTKYLIEKYLQYSDV
jgi:GNAT superfamily N-acetyltransferase